MSTGPRGGMTGAFPKPHGKGRPRATKTYKAILWERQEGRCALCGRGMHSLNRRKSRAQHPNDPTIDHIVPVSKGGDGRRDNLQLAHRKCNMARGNEPLPIGPSAALRKLTEHYKRG